MHLNLDIEKIDLKKLFYVFVSQSGETADTYAALDICKKNKMKTCSIVNVVESSIARDSKFVLPIHCGPEIGVASTKAFLGQMLVLYILCLKLSFDQKIIKKKYIKKIKNLLSLSKLCKKTLLTDNEIQSSKAFIESKGSMFLGRGYSFPIALEGALKLKELSLCSCRRLSSRRNETWSFSINRRGNASCCFGSKRQYYKKTISNMQEVIARGAKVLLITNKSKDEIYSENIWEKIEVENTTEDLFPF